MAGNIQRHPASGLGDLMPGWFDVPENPMSRPVTYTPRIGDILATNGYSVPQNPIKDYATGQVKMIGQDGSGGCVGLVNGEPVGNGMGGCGCGGGCGGSKGMGDISLDLTNFTTDLTAGNIMQAIQDPIFGLPVWGWLALGFVFVSAGGGNSHVNRARRAARAY